jgi:hypothetical protein
LESPIEFEDLIQSYNDAVGDATAKWREFMLAAGSLLASRRDELPPALRQRLDDVNSQWAADTVHWYFLRDVKLECWAFLEAKHGDSIAIVDQEDRAVRAMLTLLEPFGDELAATDAADWLAVMLRL